MKNDETESTAKLIDTLSERVKEYETLYAVAEVLSNREISMRQALQSVVERLPDGWQYPDICRVRVTCLGVIYQTANFEETSWMQRVPIFVKGELAGMAEVAYPVNRSIEVESPFLKEERKLLEVVAQKVGNYVAQRQTEAQLAKEGKPRSRPRGERRAEWRSILAFVRETDLGLHRRIVRRLMNHLTMLGIPEIHALILQFDAAIYAERDRESRGANQPLPRRDIAEMEKLFDEVVRLAGVALKEDELALILKQWIRQDQLGFFALAIERRNISLVELGELVNRFCRETREGDTALSRSDETNARVALTRRILTDSLSFIRVAREHLRIHDFGRMLQRIIGPAQGSGKLGGKASGLILAWHILKRRAHEFPLLGSIKMPLTWYITSDGLNDYLHYNALEDLQSFKFSRLDEVRHNYPYLEQVFKHSYFNHEIVQQLRVAIEDLGEGPLIIRSSSLLEDSEGTAFSGKYKSLFLTNHGSKEERLLAVLDAISEVYASTFGPDPIQYRSERGLLDFMEEMGIVIQKVVGRQIGKYFFPVLAGVAFSNNEFRWSPRIKRDDGIIRLVTGLGTRAVDRIGDDFPALISPGRPDLRVNVTPDQIVRYSQRTLDVLNLETGRFESPPVEEIFRKYGDEFPLIERIVSTHDRGILRKPIKGMLDPTSSDLVVTFAGLVENTDFVKQMRQILHVLQEALGLPVDVEFAHDGRDLYLLQCRSQSRLGDDGQVSIPHWIPEKHKIFSANKYVTNGRVTGIRYVVYVDPAGYARLSSRDDMVAVADAVSRLNTALPRRSFILLGPGRWGSRGDITLGVGVTYAGICNTQMLIEIARQKGSYVPDLSFGTHFFQDLVEANIRYLALYPDEPDVLFEEEFFLRSPNLLPEILPDFDYLQRVVRVIDVRRLLPDGELQVFMDGENDQALAFLVDPSAHAQALTRTG